jgi:hypothetical protein
MRRLPGAPGRRGVGIEGQLDPHPGPPPKGDQRRGRESSEVDQPLPSQHNKRPLRAIAEAQRWVNPRSNKLRDRAHSAPGTHDRRRSEGLHREILALFRRHMSPRQ